MWKAFTLLLKNPFLRAELCRTYAPTDMIGEHLSHYLIESEVGRGGMGIVSGQPFKAT